MNQISLGSRIVRIGGSIDARESCILSASITLNETTNILTVTTILGPTHSGTLVPHYLHQGTWVFVAAEGPPGANKKHAAVENIWARGRASLVNDSTFTLNWTAGPTGLPPLSTSNNFIVLIPNRFAHGCLQRELNSRFNGALSLVANFSTGETATYLLQTRLQDIFNLNPDVIVGDCGLGDLVLDCVAGRITYAQATGSFNTFVSAIVNAGIQLELELPQGNIKNAPTNIQASLSGVVANLLADLRAYLDGSPGVTTSFSVRQVAIADPTIWTIVPSTGMVNTALLRLTAPYPPAPPLPPPPPPPPAYDDTHPNRFSERRRSEDVYEILAPKIPPYITPPIALSIQDRVNSGGTPIASNNIYCGGWDVDVVPVSTTNFGTAANWFSPGSAVGLGTSDIVFQTSSSRSPVSLCTAQYVQNMALGCYDQIFTFTGGLLNETFTFVMSGRKIGGGTGAGWPMVATIIPGHSYKLFAEVDFDLYPIGAPPVQSKPGVIKDYSLYVRALIQYTLPDGTVIPYYGLLGAAVANTAFTGTKASFVELDFSIYADQGDLTIFDPLTGAYAPFTGLHLTEAMYLPLTTELHASVQEIAVVLSVSLAGHGGVSDSASITLRRIALRDIGVYPYGLETSGFVKGLPTPPPAPSPPDSDE